MAVKIPLKMSDGTTVRTIEELREHFNFVDVLGYYESGRLVKWLSDGYYDEEAEQVKTLDSSSEDFRKDLCNILGVDYQEYDNLDLEDISKRNERLGRLRQYTADDRILASVDSVAFTQKELDNLIKKADTLEKDDDDNTVIYLCGEHFTIPAGIGGVIYKGVNSPNPTVTFDGEIVEAGIDLQDLEFDIVSYVNGDLNKFYKAFDESSILGIKLLRMAAEKGSMVAQMALGKYYEKGFGEVKNDKEAVKWYRKAAEQGNTAAQNRLEDVIKKNERLDRLRQYTADDSILAFVDNVAFTQEELDSLLKKVYQLKKDDDDNMVIYLCGEHFTIPANIFGIKYKGVNEPNPTVTFVDKFNGEHVGISIDLQDLEFDIVGYVNGDYRNFALTFFYNEDLGMKFLRMAAEKGSTEAQSMLGNCYYEGHFIKEDGEEAVKWYRKAAEQGNTAAQSGLGLCYYEGKGVPQNYEEAVKWYRKAAEQGYAAAQSGLGLCYYEGKGVPQNYEEAVKWYRKAAEQGYAEAQSRLGQCYECGIGVEWNEKEAIKWFQKAAKQGDTVAEIVLEVKRQNNGNSGISDTVYDDAIVKESYFDDDAY